MLRYNSHKKGKVMSPMFTEWNVIIYQNKKLYSIQQRLHTLTII